MGTIIVLPVKQKRRPKVALNKRERVSFSREASQIQIEFATRLRMVRSKHHESAAKGAAALGLEHERYRRWERAETEPNIENLQNICDQFGCNADFLVRNIIPN